MDRKEIKKHIWIIAILSAGMILLTCVSVEILIAQPDYVNGEIMMLSTIGFYKGSVGVFLIIVLFQIMYNRKTIWGYFKRQKDKGKHMKELSIECITVILLFVIVIISI